MKEDQSIHNRPDYPQVFLNRFMILFVDNDIYPQGAKNEVLQIICATLLTAEEVTVHNINAHGGGGNGCLFPPFQASLTEKGGI